MSRYIDADKFVERIKASPAFSNMGQDGFFLQDVVLEILKKFPAVKSTADVVEVVRCKDCKHNVANWQHDELDIEDYTDIVCDYFMTDGMEVNDYCSHGERKEE